MPLYEDLYPKDKRSADKPASSGGRTAPRAASGASGDDPWIVGLSILGIVVVIAAFVWGGKAFADPGYDPIAAAAESRFSLPAALGAAVGASFPVVAALAIVTRLGEIVRACNPRDLSGDARLSGEPADDSLTEDDES